MKSLLRLSPVVAALVLSGCGQDGQQAAGPPPGQGPAAVGFVTLKSQSVPRSTELPGRVVALATAEIRPQVDGIVRRIVFQEGKQVAEGDVLYELNDASFTAAVAAAAANVKKTEASTDAAQSAFGRSEKLMATNAVSVQTFDEARSTLLQAQADREAAKATLLTSQIQLDHATIRAPISGSIGVSTVSVGALVTQNQTAAMVTIRQVDPIYVDLVDSSANLLRIREEVEAGRLGREKGAPATVTLTLENAKPYALKGQLSLADMVVSQSTGTFSLRATFPNPDRMLLPGMFVRATVDLGTMPNAFLVAQRAVARNASGEATAFFVTKDGKAEQRVLTVSGVSNNDWIVIGGVTDGDKLIVDGFQRLSDGTAVDPLEAAIDDDGIVKQTLKADAAIEPGKGAGK